MRHPSKRWYLLLALAILVLDQWSKWLVEAHLPHHAVEPVIPGLLNLAHVRNTGIAFGIFADGLPGAGPAEWQAWALAALGLVALAVVVVYFLRTPPSQRMLLTALGLVLGGAVGNLMDRVASGAVTDFVDFYIGTHHWHTFNVADSAITIGLVLMAFDSFRAPRPEAAPAAAA